MGEGSDGREGKYFEWRAERKLGSEGARSGGFGARGKCCCGGGGGGGGGGVLEAGCRSGGGCTGGASGSENSEESGLAESVARTGSCPASVSPNSTFLEDVLEGKYSSS